MLKGWVYKLSGYVTWSSNRNRNSTSVMEIDFTMEIPAVIKDVKINTRDRYPIGLEYY